MVNAILTHLNAHLTGHDEQRFIPCGKRIETGGTCLRDNYGGWQKSSSEAYVVSVDPQDLQFQYAAWQVAASSQFAGNNVLNRTTHEPVPEEAMDKDIPSEKRTRQTNKAKINDQLSSSR